MCNPYASPVEMLGSYKHDNEDSYAVCVAKYREIDKEKHLWDHMGIADNDYANKPDIKAVIEKMIADDGDVMRPPADGKLRRTNNPDGTPLNNPDGTLLNTLSKPVHSKPVSRLLLTLVLAPAPSALIRALIQPLEPCSRLLLQRIALSLKAPSLLPLTISLAKR